MIAFRIGQTRAARPDHARNSEIRDERISIPIDHYI